MYKMIVSDLDGTLLNRNKDISKEDIMYIKKALDRGLIFVIATGRIYRSARYYGDLLGSRVDIASSNGAYTVNHKQDVILKKGLSADALIEIDKITEKYNQYFYFYDTNNIYTKQNDLLKVDSSKFYPQSRDLIELEKYRHIEEIISSDISVYKALIVSPDTRLLDEITQDLKQISGVTITSSSRNNIEINSLGINKGLAVTKLAESYNIALDEIIAVGDNKNDISMLRVAGLGISVENAWEGTKEASDYVTVSNDQDPLSNIIKEFVL